MEPESSANNTTTVITKERIRRFIKIYWRTLIILFVPLLLMPLALCGNNAYKALYVFLVMVSYWTADVLHSGVISLVGVALSCLFNGMGFNFINELYLRNDAIESIAMMMIIAAVEYSNVEARVALKVLLIFGCSHYKLSFVIFYLSMFLSMWIPSILTCGLMMTLSKAILTQLEKMGILDIFHTLAKMQKKSMRHEQNLRIPSDLTIFYFLGIAYSSSIGEIATIMGSQTNRMFKIYSETIFPTGPKIEFPHLMLLSLPGVILMETFMYMWMNFHFLGLFRSHNETSVEIGLTEEEAQYVNNLLASEYIHLGKITFHEVVVLAAIMLTVVLQIIGSIAVIGSLDTSYFHNHLFLSSPYLFSVVLLFIVPVNLDFTKFFRRYNYPDLYLPITTTKSCLNWDLVASEIHWNVPIIIVCSGCVMDSLKNSGFVDKLLLLFMLFENWPILLVLLIVITCKFLTEFAPNTNVASAMLPAVAKLGLSCRINPHYLMTAATLSGSLSFHLMPGSPVNAMVSTYVNIPPWKMMYAGIGPSLAAVLVIWATVVVWSKAVWEDITQYLDWAAINSIKML